MENIREIVATVKKLSSMNPADPAIAEVSASLAEMVGADSAPEAITETTIEVASDDADFLYDQLKQLHAAAETPSKNYGRILAISSALGRAVQISRRPQYASLRPRIAAIVEKVAGLFAEVDTAEDLDKPLSAIEKAVHSLYGNQSANATFYLDRRGKGHHNNSAK